MEGIHIYGIIKIKFPHFFGGTGVLAQGLILGR
jgi:hypothetical protein